MAESLDGAASDAGADVPGGTPSGDRRRPAGPSDAPAQPADRPADRALRAAEHARDAAETSRDRFAFLAEVSRVLAESLDSETTLATVAGLALPYLGAWAIVDLLADDGQIRRLAVLHPDPAKQDVARTLHRRYPPRPDDLIGAPRVLRTHRPEVVLEVTDGALAAAARDANHLALLRALGTRAYVIVPMVARGRTLGAITFVTADASARFGDADLLLAEDLARRAAAAVDNARLHREADAARRAAEASAEEAEVAAERARAAEALAAAAAEEAHRARAAAEAALAARGQFLATMSHELRTPLNAIGGYTQLLELGIAGPTTPGQRDYLARLAASGRHLLGLVNDVLDLAKVDAGEVTVAREAATTDVAVAAALDLVRPQAAARGVALVDGNPQDTTAYVGDEHRVRQILVNLLSNAVKFTPAGGSVTVTCGRAHDTPPEARLAGAGPWAFLRVADTGVGIAPAEQAAVFEPFHQVEQGHTRTQGGTGLGLAISRRLARLMGGDLTLESAPGRGSTFTLWLPAAGGVAYGEGGAEETTLARVVRAAHARPGLVRGLGALGDLLRRQLDALVAAYVARLRAEPGAPLARAMPQAELEDHLVTALADLAQSLVIVGEAGRAEVGLLADSVAINTAIAARHGARRLAQGWDEAALRADYAVVREVLARAVRADARAGGADAEAALAVLLSFVDQSEARGVAAWRADHARATPARALRAVAAPPAGAPAAGEAGTGEEPPDVPRDAS